MSVLVEFFLISKKRRNYFIIKREMAFSSPSEFYKKSPLPDAETLGMIEIGSSHLTEMIPEACVCGRPLAFLAYKAATECAGFSNSLGATSSNRSESYRIFADKHRLGLCCRTRMLAPVVSNIVSADIGARRVEFGPSEKATIENAPSAGTSLASSIPPQLIFQSKKT